MLAISAAQRLASSLKVSMTKGSRLFKVGSGAKLITGWFKVFFTLLSPKFAMIVICEFACIFLVPMPKISL